MSADEAVTWSEARRLREAGVDIVTVGVGSSVRESELRAIATFPNLPSSSADGRSNVFVAESFEDLRRFADDVTSATCNSGFTFKHIPTNLKAILPR